jgi:hypothetical protein
MDPENWIALGLGLPLPDVKIRLMREMLRFLSP